MLCVPAGLLTDGDGAVGFVEVAPLERDRLALSQSADQFQLEHRRGIAENEFFFHRPVKGIVQHHMDAAHSGIAQSGFFLFLYLSQPAIALQIVVELLQVTGGELIQRDIPDSRDDMLFDVSVVVVHGRRTDV